MKKTALAASLAASVMMSLGAQAQTSSSSSASVAAPATQTTTATVAEVKPAAASPWSGALAVAAYSNIQAQKDKGSNAAIESYNTALLRYKLTEKDTVVLAHNFSYNSVPTASDRAETNEGYVLEDPYIRWNRSLGAVLWNEKTTLALRYYLPVSEASREKGSNGFLRAGISLPYTVTKLVEVDYSLDARAYFSAGGSESFQARNYGTLTLNFTDTFSAYSTLGLWGAFTDHGVLNKTSDRVYGATGISSSAIKDVSLSFYVESLVPSRPKELYSAANTAYNLETVVSF